MNDLQMWELIVGFLSATFVIPMLQQPGWSEGKRAGITFAFSVVAGLVTAYLSGAFDGIHDFKAGVTGVLVMFVAAIASYKGFAKPTGIAPAIERATSPAASHP